MDKAFDVVFQTKVDAAIIAKTSYCTYGEQFRYQCLYCGEEVYLAAADSTEKTPHFRHRRGNNDIDCDRYLGQPGAVESYVSISRERNKARIGFYFNIDRLTFEICLSLTSEEIDVYSQQQVNLHLCTNYFSRSFLSVPINRSVLKPNTSNYFTVNEYANDYYASSDSSNMKYSYLEVMKKDRKLNIYRVNQQDEHYKKNTSDLLYTNTEYVAISESKENIKGMLSLQSIEMIENAFSFITIGKNFHAVKFVIKHAEHDVRLYFQNNDYQIETLESLDILWPPVFCRDTAMITYADDVFVSSSFEMIPHGNIDIEESETEEIDRGIYKITIDDKTAIYEKNVDVVIFKEKQKNCEHPQDEQLISHTDMLVVSDDCDYFLFDKNGCTRLIAGSRVYLSKDDKIIGYKNSHVKTYIYSSIANSPNTEEALGDILKYHPQTEPFNPDEFMTIDVNETILNYLETCYRSGMINSIAKRYIREKKI